MKRESHTDYTINSQCPSCKNTLKFAPQKCPHWWHMSCLFIHPCILYSNWIFTLLDSMWNLCLLPSFNQAPSKIHHASLRWKRITLWVGRDLSQLGVMFGQTFESRNHHLQSRPLLVMTRVETPFLGVITPVTHLHHLWGQFKGDISPLIT